MLKWGIGAFGVLLAAWGLWWGVSGYSVVEVERGWSALIAGAVVFSAGAIIVAISALMQRVDALISSLKTYPAAHSMALPEHAVSSYRDATPPAPMQASAPAYEMPVAEEAKETASDAVSSAFAVPEKPVISGGLAASVATATAATGAALAIGASKAGEFAVGAALVEGEKPAERTPDLDETREPAPQPVGRPAALEVLRRPAPTLKVVGGASRPDAELAVTAPSAVLPAPPQELVAQESGLQESGQQEALQKEPAPHVITHEKPMRRPTVPVPPLADLPATAAWPSAPGNYIEQASDDSAASVASAPDGEQPASAAEVDAIVIPAPPELPRITEAAAPPEAPELPPMPPPPVANLPPIPSLAANAPKPEVIPDAAETARQAMATSISAAANAAITDAILAPAEPNVCEAEEAVATAKETQAVARAPEPDAPVSRPETPGRPAWIDDLFEELDQMSVPGMEDAPKAPPQTAESPVADKAESASPKAMAEEISKPAPELVIESAVEPAKEQNAEETPPVSAPPPYEAAPPPLEQPLLAPAQASPKNIVRSYDSQGVTYHLYDDGSIDAQTSGGTFHFASLDELRQFIEKRGA